MARPGATRSASQEFQDFVDKLTEQSTGFLQDTCYQVEERFREPSFPPWNDRSSGAREGLYVRGSNLSGHRGYWRFQIRMGYQVSYGYWLETKNYYHESDNFPGRPGHTARVLSNLFGDTEVARQRNGRDALLNPAMGYMMPFLLTELRRMWEGGPRAGYRARFARGSGVSYRDSGQHVSVVHAATRTFGHGMPYRPRWEEDSFA